VYAREVTLLLFGENAVGLSLKTGNFVSQTFFLLFLPLLFFSFEFCSALGSFSVDT
jgi:hypothetical protein